MSPIRIIARGNTPLIIKNKGVLIAESDHRFDRDTEPRLHLWSSITNSIIEYSRVFVHRPPDTVTHVLLQNPVWPCAQDVVLNRDPNLI